MIIYVFFFNTLFVGSWLSLLGQASWLAKQNRPIDINRWDPSPMQVPLNRTALLDQASCLAKKQLCDWQVKTHVNPNWLDDSIWSGTMLAKLRFLGLWLVGTHIFLVFANKQNYNLGHFLLSKSGREEWKNKRIELLKKLLNLPN